MLEGLRARTSHYIPAKGAEKHGLSAGKALELFGDGPGLVVTVDCGITNRDEIAELGRHGKDVVVTDHHEQAGDLPPAAAIVDPKLPDSGYPYRGLAGVGVALKLGIGIAGEALGVSLAEFVSAEPDLLALAVLGTVADRVPLTGENRDLVAAGLPLLERTGMTAVRMVLGRLKYEGRITPLKMVPKLLPLFAAAEGNDGVERLVDTDSEKAGEWLDVLEQRAEQWRRDAEQSVAVAERVAQVGDGVVVVRSRELSLRALGFCAARLKQRYNFPVLVMGWRGDAWVGECRGVEGMSLIDLLGATAEFLEDYGGHRLAGGFTVREENVDRFVRSLEEYTHREVAGRIAARPGLQADAEMPLRDFDPGLVRLAPFGEGNRPPLLVSEPTRVSERGTEWIPDVAPERRLTPGRPGLIPHAGPMNLLYSVDDDGRLSVVDLRPAGNA